MDLEFNKTVLQYLRCVVNEVKDLEQTGEIKLPDGTPDIGRVLCCWGQTLVRGKEWRGDGLAISGGVMVKVLYEPDGTDALQCTEIWIPFQTKCEFEQMEKDGNICVISRLLALDARTASARKMIVRARIGLGIKATIHDRMDVSVAPELPADIQLLKNKYPVQLPVEAGEKAFAIEENITLLDSEPVMAKMISCNATPVSTETKVMGDKLIFRGTVKLHIVYISTDVRLCSREYDIPFSQFTQLDGEYNDDAYVSMHYAVTGMEIEKEEGDLWNGKVSIVAQYTLYNRTTVEFIEDVFSPVRKLNCKTVDVDIPAILHRRDVEIKSQCSADTESKKVIDAVFYHNFPGIYTQEGQGYADLSGTFQLLTADMDGILSVIHEKWEQSIPVDMDDKTQEELYLNMNDVVDVAVETDLVRVQTDGMLEIVTINSKPITMITGIELGDTLKQDSDRPSVIVRRVYDESLWEIAKSSGSTVDAIRKANTMEGEPQAGQLLLIPISHS